MTTITLSQAFAYSDIRGITAETSDNTGAHPGVPLENVQYPGEGIVFHCSNPKTELLGRTRVHVTYNHHGSEYIHISSIQP